MFRSEKGSEFIRIKNYTNANGEISHQTLNVGIDVLNAKKKDLKSLQSVTIEKLYEIADKKGIDKKIAETALSELLASQLKNVSTEIENRTVNSQAQSDAYVHINKGMKVLKDSGVLYVAGFVVDKTVIVKGEYKTVNSQDKTIMKDAIKKELNLKMNAYRSFVFKNAEAYKINGNDIELK